MLTRRLLIGLLLSTLPRFALAQTSTQERAQLSFDSLYKSFGIRGLEFSERVSGLKGRPIVIFGYMAPPLKPESNFFVLTKEPMAICPFCQSDADWPLDIVVVYLKKASPLVSAGQRVKVMGRLDVGSWTDPESGFVSQIRIMDCDYAKV